MSSRRPVAIALVALAALTAIGITAGAPRRTAAAPAPVAIDASDATAAFDRANTAFAEGRYAQAAADFAAVAAAHGASPELLFNLGNASFRAGHVGQAVLAYEQALALAPRTSSAAANLRQVRSAANLAPPEEGAIAGIAGRLTPDGWARLASGALALACAALAAGRLLRVRLAPESGPARALRSAAALAAAAAVLGGAGTWQALRRLDRAVVVGDGLALQVAPFASATASSAVASGEIVERERGHAGFALVRTADGRSGWLPEAAVRRIGDLTPWPAAPAAPPPAAPSG